MERKKELRKHIALLKTQHADSTMRKLQSANILTALEAHPAFRAAHIVLLYYSLKDEVDTHEFVRKWSREKRILLPVVVGDDLELRVYTGPEDLTVMVLKNLPENSSPTMQLSTLLPFPA